MIVNDDCAVFDFTCFFILDIRLYLKNIRSLSLKKEVSEISLLRLQFSKLNLMVFFRLIFLLQYRIRSTNNPCLYMWNT